MYSSVMSRSAGRAAVLAGLPPAVSRFAAHPTGLRPGAIPVCAAGRLEAGATLGARREETLYSCEENNDVEWRKAEIGNSYNREIFSKSKFSKK